MFFLIRCVFWLTVVFSTIFNPGQGPTAPSHRTEATRQPEALKTGPATEDSAARLGQTGQNWVIATIESFWGKAKGGCGGSSAECVALASRLSDFARRYSFDDRSAQDESRAGPISLQTAQAYAPPSPATARVPLPPLRPQNVRLLEKPANSGHASEKHPSGAHAVKGSGRR